MSYSDRSKLTVGQNLGFATYAIFGGLISFYSMVGAALADCASDRGCISETTRAMMFYGVPLVTFVGGMLLTRYFMRDKE